VSAPQLRFPEFSGEWIPAKAGAAFKNRRAKGEAGLPIFSVTLDRGLVRRDSLDRHMAADAADGVNLRAQRGDLVYNMMRMWQGAVGIAPVECMISPAYVVLAPKKETSSEFFDYWFKSARMLYLLWAYSHGLTSDRLRLYFDDFAKIPVHLPTLPEQEKIALFLGVVDAKIAALRAKVAGLETYKRGLMQALFTQRLRFTKPDGTAFPDWEERSLIELASEKFSNGVFNDPEKVGSGYKIVNVKDMYEKGPINSEGLQRVAISTEEFLKNKAEHGDVFFTRSSLVKEGVAHSNVFLSQSQETTFDGHLIRLRPNRRVVEPKFLFYILRTDELRRQLVARGKTGTMTTIGQEDIASVLVPLPHPNEQQKIADALSVMDAKIQAVSAQVSHMETFKKGLLQQMFV
jgi:type I restriction enzyme, S subunit